MFPQAVKLLSGFGIPLALLLAGCASTQDASSTQDSRYVKVSDTSGYYVLRSTSPMVDKLGLGGAPLSETSGQLHAGRGNDVIAFTFKQGVLSKPPAYIYQAEPRSYYTERLKGLSIGTSTFEDVKGLFPGSILVREQGGSLVYLTFRVRNPSERSP